MKSGEKSAATWAISSDVDVTHVHPTDRASAATNSADRQRDAAKSRRQNATELRNTELFAIGCQPLFGGAKGS